jgi:putative proteasome-type protease
VTFCVGVRVRDGIVGLADTQVVRGDEVSSKVKLERLLHAGSEIMFMFSGLRSVQDKVMLRFEDTLASRPVPHRRLHQLVSAFGEQLQAVRAEDGPWLESSGLTFNSHAIIGGQLADDLEPQLFLVYPQGNWVVATPESPYFIIGRTAYGKPILDRLLTFDSSLRTSTALAYLAFDSTRASVIDVDFPIDVVLLPRGDHELRQHRFEAVELEAARHFWRDSLAAQLAAFPTDWATPLFADASEDA